MVFGTGDREEIEQFMKRLRPVFYNSFADDPHRFALAVTTPITDNEINRLTDGLDLNGVTFSPWTGDNLH